MDAQNDVPRHIEVGKLEVFSPRSRGLFKQLYSNIFIIPPGIDMTMIEIYFTIRCVRVGFDLQNIQN